LGIDPNVHREDFNNSAHIAGSAAGFTNTSAAGQNQHNQHNDMSSLPGEPPADLRPIAGLRLPRTTTDWAEVNSYFRFCRPIGLGSEMKTIEDVDNAASTFQNKIYSFLRDSFGVHTSRDKRIKANNIIPERTAINANNRRLRSRLRQLKAKPDSDNMSIIAISKMLRRGLQAVRSGQSSSVNMSCNASNNISNNNGNNIVINNHKNFDRKDFFYV